MIDKKNLLSIGNFAKQTGANIKALRYYDEIGILPATYIDPLTNYRYYSFEQIPIIDIIQLCVNLGIPLKELKKFAIKENNKINYAYLLEYGKELTQNKMREIQRKYNLLENVEKELIRVNSYSDKAEFEMPEKHCYITLFDGSLTSSNYHIVLKELFSKMTMQNIKVGYDCGIICFYRNNKKESYIFIDVDYDENIFSDNIIHIPASKFICLKNKSSMIKKVPTIFPDLFNKDYDKIVIETREYTGEFEPSNPYYEIRCNLPK